MQIKSFTTSHSLVGASENAYFSSTPRTPLSLIPGKSGPLISPETISVGYRPEVGLLVFACSALLNIAK